MDAELLHFSLLCHAVEVPPPVRMSHGVMHRVKYFDLLRKWAPTTEEPIIKKSYPMAFNHFRLSVLQKIDGSFGKFAKSETAGGKSAKRSSGSV